MTEIERKKPIMTEEINAFCRGVWHRGKDIVSLVDTLEVGQELILERDPENAYDMNAIKVYYEEIWVGFVAKEVAELLSPKMITHKYKAVIEGFANRSTPILLITRVELEDEGNSDTPIGESA